MHRIVVQLQHGVVGMVAKVILHLRQIRIHFLQPLFAGQNIFDKILIKPHVGVEDGLQLFVRLPDFHLIFFELDIDPIDFLAHRVVFGQDLFQLLLKVIKQFGEEAFLFICGDLFDVELVHNVAKGIEHLAGVVDLAHIDAIQNGIGTFCNLVSHFAAKRDNRLRVVHNDLADQVVYFLGPNQGLGHFLPLQGNVIGFRFLHRRGGGRCLDGLPTSGRVL